jgi:hypothetical protein
MTRTHPPHTQVLAATPEDSQERFNARKLWPSFAKRLRDVGPAAPVVAGLITGSQDKEETLSELYGGKSAAPGVRGQAEHIQPLSRSINTADQGPECR